MIKLDFVKIVVLVDFKSISWVTSPPSPDFFYLGTHVHINSILKHVKGRSHCMVAARIYLKNEGP